MSHTFAAYLASHREQHLEQLKQFLRFPSISTQPEYAQDVRACAEYLAQAMREIGLDGIAVMETPGHPVVYGERLAAPGKPTVLIYGHYDVQPVDPLELWQTPPFEPTVRDGRLYARGSSDDKGQVFMHLKTLEALLATEGELPVNVKLLIEGEEEIGSRHLEGFVEQHRDLLQADVVVISDTTMLAPDQPSVCYGLRGLAALQIDVRGAKGDLHSGLYGGAVQNPIRALVHILDSMHDDSGRITVDGFYDGVQPLSEEERRSITALPFDDAQLAAELEVPALYGEAGYTTLERLWVRPTLEFNGIYGGYQGSGTKTVIPNEAHAKVTCRLVPDQDPERVFEAIEAHVRRHAPPGVTASVQRFDAGRAYVAPFDHPAIQQAARAYEKAYGKPAAFTRMGGSIGVVDTFARLLGAPIVMMGFASSDENFHAPNEFFRLANLEKGLETLCWYWLGLEDALRGK
ncbi:dipeptidase [Alicyclobacillus shizuokensis]|uniref:dipeptidase n=1 Tax=Alicyclobacillus shizuokensis TaxID=392014 RepID=UPI000831CD67|nr:dipeptidase [Alicyclobacillus shizuokensis]